MNQNTPDNGDNTGGPVGRLTDEELAEIRDTATKPHHTHACQSCGLAWRPAIHPTVGVQFLPGFKDEDP